MLALLLLACGREAEPYPLEFLERPPSGSDPAPMVVALHGNGGRPERMLAMAEGCGLDVRWIVPRGTRKDPDGSFHWFDIRLPRRPSWDVAQATEQTDRVAALIRRLLQERPTRGLPVVTGFSGGGVLSYGLVARHPDLIRAAVPISATLSEEMWPTDRPAPEREPVVHALQPEDDRVNPTALARAVARKVTEKGVPVRLEVLPGLDHGFDEALSPYWCEAVRAALP